MLIDLIIIGKVRVVNMKLKKDFCKPLESSRVKKELTSEQQIDTKVRALRKRNAEHLHGALPVV